MGAGASVEEATAAGTERINSLFSSLVFGTAGFIDGEVLAGLIAADAGVLSQAPSLLSVFDFV
jgi:hypothetical protein